MAITFATETVADVRGDIGPLLQFHYDELAMHKDAISLAPDWQRYLALEQARRLLVFTARDDEHLIGYAAFFVDVHIHYSGSLVASNDVIFLHKDYRRGSTAGADLITYSEDTLRTYGVNKVLWHIKFKFNWSAILKRRGYAPEDFTMGKLL